MRRVAVIALVVGVATTARAFIIWDGLEPVQHHRSSNWESVAFRSWFTSGSATGPIPDGGGYSSGFSADTGQPVIVSRGSSATLFSASNGLLTTVANDIARVERYADGGSGLLVESASANELYESGDFSNGDWVKAGAAVTGNQGTFVDGTQTMARLVATSGTSYIEQIALVTSSVGPFTSSVWMASDKTDGGTQQVTLGGGCDASGLHGSCVCGSSDPARPCAAFDDSFTGDCEAAVTVGPNPVRVSVTYTCLSATTHTDTTAWLGTFGASTGSMFIGGAQNEPSAWVSSYIPTVLSPLTRAADVVSVLNPITMTAGPWCIGATITPYMGMTWSAQAVGVTSAGASHAGSNSVESSITTSLSDNWAVFDATPTLKNAANTLLNSNAVRLVQCANAGTLTQWVNGVQVASTISGAGTGAPASNPATLYLGSLAGGGTTWANAYLSDVTACTGISPGACQ